jgi:long-subunit acyl-CoA synthetase (AMP-forming)
MTEASPGIAHMVKGCDKYKSVGGPIPNTEMKVVNSESQSSLAARETGEICVRGPQVRQRTFSFCWFPYLDLMLFFM